MKEGDKAPVFKGIDQNGKKISLSDLKGKKVILFFYPKDNTPTCTNEACNLRDNYSALLKKGFEVIGVSADTEKSHKKFIGKYSLPYTLIADTEKEIINQYGVWDEKMLFGRKYMGIVRKTFIIDEKGIIRKIFEKVDSKNHTEQILEALS
jgi:thioredoxin-dependent peroxiredoxin